MILDASSAELLLDKYEVERNHNPEAIYFPKELIAQDKETILLNYINSSNTNLNYLSLIVNIKSTSDFTISDRTRLKARKRVEEQENQLFNKDSGTYMETSVTFLDSHEEVVKQEVDGQRWAFSYNSRWIKDNNDFHTLMNNFIFLFEFVDLQMRVTLVNKPQEMGIFEQHVFMRSKNSYTIGVAFQQKDILSKLQIVGYYKELTKMGIRIEGIVEWFFKSYIPEEFNITGFRIKMPSEHSLFIEKCRAILPEMESVLKQFTLYVEDNSIDQELLQMSSGHLLYKNVPSLLEKKYVYGTGEDFKQATYYFFSNQCMLSYVEKIGSKYHNFFDLLMNEEVSVNDYLHYHGQDIEWLIKHKYIEINSEGYIKIYDINRLYILKDLFTNEVINYWRYPLKLREKLDDMELCGVAEFESSLFSRPEQDYINYYLNKSSFNNALDLRNRYSHGTQPSGDDSEDIHELNYMIFLRMFIMIIIKINDDFCIYTENKL
ncbi:hypothetical protein GNT69_20760 [Bacillus sp. B15-48]|nr:hypothetical protein [Bacillus sp. B15-48]